MAQNEVPEPAAGSQPAPQDPQAQGGDENAQGAQAVAEKLHELVANTMAGLQTILQVLQKMQADPEEIQEIAQLTQQLMGAVHSALGEGPDDEQGEQPQGGSAPQGGQPVDQMGGATGVPAY